MLTPKQLSQFETFGFLVLRQSFSPGEMLAIEKEADHIWGSAESMDTDSGHTEVGKQISGFVERSALLTNLIADDRIYVTVKQLLGPDFVYVASDGNMWAGDTVWHSDDNIRPGYKRLKVVFYLDSLRKENGCLRVIPGSHHNSFHQIMKPMIQQGLNVSLGISGEELPSFPIETSPGDVLIFCHDTFHASFGASQLRRQIALSFFAKPILDEHKTWVKALYSQIRDKSDERTAQALMNNPNIKIQNVMAGLKALGLK